MEKYMPRYIDSYAQSQTDVALLAGLGGSGATYTQGGSVANGSILFADQPAADSIITLNGLVVQFSESASDATADGDVEDPILVNIKANLSATLDEAVTVLNTAAHEDLAVATYSKTGEDNTLLVVYDTIGVAGNAYTLVASAESNGTVSGATLGQGRDAVAITLDRENISIDTSLETYTQYFTLADGKEFQSKSVVLAAKGSNAVITYNGNSTLTYDAAGEHTVMKFMGGDWRLVVNTSTAA